MIGLDCFPVLHRKLIRTYKQIGYYILTLDCENKPCAKTKKEVWTSLILLFFFIFLMKLRKFICVGVLFY